MVVVVVVFPHRPCVRVVRRVVRSVRVEQPCSGSVFVWKSPRIHTLSPHSSAPRSSPPHHQRPKLRVLHRTCRRPPRNSSIRPARPARTGKAAFPACTPNSHIYTVVGVVFVAGGCSRIITKSVVQFPPCLGVCVWLCACVFAVCTAAFESLVCVCVRCLIVALAQCGVSDMEQLQLSYVQYRHHQLVHQTERSHLPRMLECI